MTKSMGIHMSKQLDQHYFLTSSAEVDAIIQPLKDHLGITSFVYQKNFLDGSEIRLSNQPQWVKYYYEKQLYKYSIFEHAPNQYQKSRLLWASLPQHQTVLSKAKKFNIDHGITFVEPQADGCEFFFIGTTPQNPEVMSHYLNQLDVLEKFLIYFKEKTAPLIDKAKQNKILLIDKINNNAPVFDETPKFDRDAFLSRLNLKENPNFSAREWDCVKLLIQGYTFKMIARTLNISARTVETHVEHIKQKSNCHTKSELIYFLSKM